MIFIEKEFNAATGKETIIEREASAEEIAEVEAAKAEYARRELEAEAKATQKAALLNRLGITEDEAKLLLA